MNCKGNIININPAKNTISLAKTSFAALSNLLAFGANNFDPKCHHQNHQLLAGIFGVRQGGRGVRFRRHR